MVAFERAVRLGYRYVETDAHVTRDGALIAFHDDRLDRVTDHRGRIADLDWETIRGARVAGEPIPLLADLLGAWPKLRINIDPKSDAAVAPLAAAIERTAAIDRVAVGSFSDRRLTRIRTLLGPRLCTSLGPRAVLGLRLGSYGLPGARALDGGCVQVPVRHFGLPVADARFVRAAHARGLQVHVWTINDPEEMRRLVALGVDGLMTDRPETLKRVLEELGRWSPSV